MIHHCRVDASRMVVKNEFPDLDIDLLTLDDIDVSELDRPELYAEAAHIRSALVARVADIVKKSANEPSALDAAVAMVEVLVSSYGSAVAGRGQAMQAIQLLASTWERFDDALDLFFDLVERSCMHQRGQSLNLSKPRPYADALSNQTIHTFDETLVKLLSKRLYVKESQAKWDVVKPLQRISALRKELTMREIGTARLTPCCRATSLASTVFYESQKMLLSISKKRYGDVLLPRVQSYGWMKDWKSWATPPCLRAALVNREARASMILTESPVRSSGQRKIPQMQEAERTISQKDAEILDLKQQIRMLYGDTKTAGHVTVQVDEIEEDAVSSYTFTDDSDMLSDTGTASFSLYHAL